MRAILASALMLLIASSASADLRVLESSDVVILHDGTEIRGTVIAVGMKAVVMVVDDKERLIPRAQVKKIVRGEVKPDVQGYKTEVVEGMKRITGPGESQAGGDAAPSPTKPGPGPMPGPGPTSAPVITKERLLALMKTNPMVNRIVQQQGGPDAALKWLEKNRSNPAIMKYLQGLMGGGGKKPGGMRPRPQNRGPNKKPPERVKK